MLQMSTRCFSKYFFMNGTHLETEEFNKALLIVYDKRDDFRRYCESGQIQLWDFFKGQNYKRTAHKNYFVQPGILLSQLACAINPTACRAGFCEVQRRHAKPTRASIYLRPCISRSCKYAVKSLIETASVKSKLLPFQSR